MQNGSGENGSWKRFLRYRRHWQHRAGIRNLARDDDLADTAAFCAHYQVPPENSVNAILVRDKADGDNHALCMVPATHRLDVNKTVRSGWGRKASFATPDETRAITGMEIGGVTPIGLPAGVRVWVEESVMGLDYIILGAATGHQS